MTKPAPLSRSQIMARVKNRDTKPEVFVRKIVHRLGFRFRLHRKDLPGRPDMVFPRFGLALFVHGCFWHRHPGCRLTTTPKTNAAFWDAKFARNVDRDRQVVQHLLASGWKVATIWECETRTPAKLERRLAKLFKRLDDSAH
jgi:DNA mismatch endonuclease (patch repair protein)